MRSVRYLLPALALLLLMGILSSASYAQGATFTVTSYENFGPGSLRQAIADSNANPGRDTINFNLAIGTMKIRIDAPGLQVTDGAGVILDGLTQPGASCFNPVIEVTRGYGFDETNDFLLGIQNSVIQGLLFNAEWHTPSSTLLRVAGPNNSISCNLIGTDYSGTSAANENGIGIEVTNGASNVIVDRNVISGNRIGVIVDAGAEHLTFTANLVGLKKDGACEVGNTDSGFILYGQHILIGGTTPDKRNFISGNTTFGIMVGDSSQDVVIQGNYIGLEATSPLVYCSGLSGTGISLQGAGVLVGGSDPGTGNVISGNPNTGIRVGAAYPYKGNVASNNVIKGNYIGTDPTGQFNAPNNTGIFLADYSANNVVGMDGLAPETDSERNIIAANVLDIAIFNSSANIIAGNFIGVNQDGATPIGIRYQEFGISIAGGGNHRIGTGDPVAGNIIQGHRVYGIVIQNSAGNSIRANSMSDNGSGIFFGYEANNGISSPLLTGATDAGVVRGYIEGKPNTEYSVEFFLSPACNASGYGEGLTYIATLLSTTNNLGSATIELNAPAAFAIGEYVTATKTENATGDSSMFSNCVQVQQLQIPSATFTPSLTYTPSPTRTLTKVNSATPSATSSSTPTPTATMTSSSTATVTATPTATWSPTPLPTPTATEFAPLPDTIGIYRPLNKTFYLRNSNSTGYADITIPMSTSGMTENYRDVPVVGDWNGDGVDTIGYYRRGRASDGLYGGMFWLSDSNEVIHADYVFTLGNPGDTPLVGDWDGDGRDSVGVFRPSNGLIYIKNELSTGFADYTMVLGNPGDIGIAGDWDDDGRDTPGVYRPGANPQFYLTNQLCNCVAFSNYNVSFGDPGDQPFTGDWNGDGRTGLGVYRTSNGITYLRNDPTTTGFSDFDFVYGIADDVAFGGVWISASPPSVQIEVAPTFQPSSP